MHRTVSLAFVSSALLLVSAGGAAAATPIPSPAPSASPALLLLRVTNEGGFISPIATLGRVPTVSVYTDGTIITPGDDPAADPPLLVSQAYVRNVGTVGEAAIVAALTDLGLDVASSPAPGIIGDTGDTIFTVIIDGVETVTRFHGLGGGNAAVLDLLNRLVDTTDTWGAASAPVTAYQPAAYRIFAVPGAPVSDTGSSIEPRVWPLSTPLASFGTPADPDRGVPGLRSGIVTGADAALLTPILTGATIETPFTSEGSTWTIRARPLLPDELAA